MSSWRQMRSGAVRSTSASCSARRRRRRWSGRPRWGGAGAQSGTACRFGVEGTAAADSTRPLTPFPLVTHAYTTDPGRGALQARAGAAQEGAGRGEAAAAGGVCQVGCGCTAWGADAIGSIPPNILHTCPTCAITCPLQGAGAHAEGGGGAPGDGAHPARAAGQLGGWCAGSREGRELGVGLWQHAWAGPTQRGSPAVHANTLTAHPPVALCRRRRWSGARRRWPSATRSGSG